MANGPARAEFWKEFIATHCGYPAPDRLRAQLVDAQFSDFCECGCNSFAVKVSSGVPPLASARKNVSTGHGAIYTADFRLPDEQTLEIVLFANDAGNLVYVEVDCCANSYPVPDDVEVDAEPFHTWAAERLIV